MRSCLTCQLLCVVVMSLIPLTGIYLYGDVSYFSFLLLSSMALTFYVDNACHEYKKIHEQRNQEIISTLRVVGEYYGSVFIRNKHERCLKIIDEKIGSGAYYG